MHPYDRVSHGGGEIQSNSVTNFPDNEFIWILSCRHVVHVTDIGQGYNFRELACCEGGN